MAQTDQTQTTTEPVDREALAREIDPVAFAVVSSRASGRSGEKNAHAARMKALKQADEIIAARAEFEAFPDWEETFPDPQPLAIGLDREAAAREAARRVLSVNFDFLAPDMEPSEQREFEDSITNAILALAAPAEVGGALNSIAAERHRQQSVEGWTLEHDDAHDAGQMAQAAATYAMGAALPDVERSVMDFGGDHQATPSSIWRHWPWDFAWWKPRSRRRDLVRAGALIVAEIERLDRALPAAPTGGWS